MKVVPIKQYQSPNFRSLIIENNQYSKEQETIINDIKEKSNEINPYDKQERTFLKYLKEKYDKDLFIRSSSEPDKIELNLLENDELKFIGNFSTTDPLELSDLYGCIELASIDRSNFESKLISLLIVGIIIVGGMFLAAKSKKTDNVIKTVNKEIITNKPSTPLKEALNFSKKFIK